MPRDTARTRIFGLGRVCGGSLWREVSFGGGWERERDGRRPTIDQKLALATPILDVILHGILQQLHRHLGRHDSAVPDVLADHAAELAVGTVLLRAQQIARAQVLEAVVAH